MRCFRVLLISFVFILSQNLCAQSESLKFSRFRLLLKSGKRVEGRNAVLTDTTLEGKTKTGDLLSIPRGDIRVMDAYAGSQAVKGGAIGASLGLLTGLTTIFLAKANENMLLKEDAVVGITIGLTVGGGLVGLMVGSAYPRWERVPVKTAMFIKPEKKGVMCMAQFLF